MPPPPGRKVLVADDSTVVRALVRLELETAGYTVVEVSDGKQALAVAAAGDVSVVLLDVEMPILDGFATIAALKADLATADLPVILLIGRSDPEDVLEALRLGAHDFLRKPPEDAELLARVRAAVEVTDLRHELRGRTEELDRQTRTDHLTGLANRHHLEERLVPLLASSRRHGHPLALLLVAVDPVEHVDDTVGPEDGDAVLTEVARRLAAVVREEDVLGRWAGEQFLVLAPHTDLASARVLADRVRRAVSSPPALTAGGAVPVTVSIGGASLAGGAASVGRELALRVVDANLHAAGDAGRDRCEVTPVV